MQALDASETKRNKAKNLRYKKAIAKDLNIDMIHNELCEIMEECDNVRYFFEEDSETLLNALDGNEEDEFEFKMMFADLSAECERMWEDLQWEYVPECFDDFFCAASSNEGLLGWDSFEGDYFGLGSSWEEEKAREESRKRMQRLTKDQLMETAQRCFRIFRAYIGIRGRYDSLKAAFDILRDENTGFLQIIKKIDELYEAAEHNNFQCYWSDAAKEFDRLLDTLPPRAWLE